MAASIACSYRLSLHPQWNRYPHWDRIRDQGGYRARDHDPYPDPDPHDQGIQMRLDDGTSCVPVLPLVDQVKIFLRSGAIRDHRGRGLTGFVEAALRIENSDLLALLKYVD